MQEWFEDLWKMRSQWKCITTNGICNSQGLAIMGAGVAKEAATRHPRLYKLLGRHLQENGNVPGCLLQFDRNEIWSFPTKNHWKDPSSLDLIRKSAQILYRSWVNQNGLRDNIEVAIPRPGCGLGGLDWADVKAVLEQELPDNHFRAVAPASYLPVKGEMYRYYQGGRYRILGAAEPVDSYTMPEQTLFFATPSKSFPLQDELIRVHQVGTWLFYEAKSPSIAPQILLYQCIKRNIMFARTAPSFLESKEGVPKFVKISDA